MLAFEEDQNRRFEDEMVRHIGSFSPKTWEQLGEQGVRGTIAKGIERARDYGFTKRGPMRFYLEMMFMFGPDFDTDPEHPWAREILVEKGWDQMRRADRLHEVAMEQRGENL
jgi:hypothetical protein